MAKKKETNHTRAQAENHEPAFLITAPNIGKKELKKLSKQLKKLGLSHVLVNYEVGLQQLT